MSALTSTSLLSSADAVMFVMLKSVTDSESWLTSRSGRCCFASAYEPLKILGSVSIDRP